MVTVHNVQARMLRNKYLKDLFVQWRGLTAAYDEGLIKGDAVLAAAIWRNIFAGNEEVDLTKLAEVVSYVRSVLVQLETMDDDAIATADVVFGDPSGEAAIVRAKSPMMDLGFKQPLAEGTMPDGKAGPRLQAQST